MKTVGLVGVRGFTGRELVRLMATRDDLKLVYASSRTMAGETVTQLAPEGDPDLIVEAVDEEEVGKRKVDAIILAMPNGQAKGFVDEIEAHQPETVVVDLSADYRHDSQWLYGLPEIYGRDRHTTHKRISNPGCYATAGQLAVYPLRDRLAGPAHLFGVSGFSGAGTTPSRKNDPSALADNLMAYGLVGHGHEAEMSDHLGQSVVFTPHVTSFFRGLTITAQMELAEPITRDEVIDLFRQAYDDEPLINVRPEPIPEIRDGAHINGAVVGGFAVSEDGKRVVVIGALDNLLKGAAVQTLQNLTLALGLPEFGQ